MTDHDIPADRQIPEGGPHQALKELVGAFGADPAHWPVNDPRRAAAWSLLDSDDPVARHLVSEAAMLDRALDHAAAPVPSAALNGAILQAAAKPQRMGLGAWAGRFWKPASALACAGLLGIMVGVYAPVPVASAAEQTASLETEIASLGSLDGAGFEDLSE